MRSTMSTTSNNNSCCNQGSNDTGQTPELQIGSNWNENKEENPSALPLKKKDSVKDYIKLFGQVAEAVHQMHIISTFVTGLLINSPTIPRFANRQMSLPTTLISCTHSSEDAKESSARPEEKVDPENVMNRDEDVKEKLRADGVKESPLDLLDVTEYLIYKKEDEKGPNIIGGSEDALIVHASKAIQADFLYQEAFLSTYRTFISPWRLVEKLLIRYNKFIETSDVEGQKAARNAFLLLVRIVEDLTITDFSVEAMETLTNFEYNLLCHGELLLARAFRKLIAEKHEAKKKHLTKQPPIVSLIERANLFDLKPQEIAEQMTLLDAQLFGVIETHEILIWAQEQNEEKSPNLTIFTDHFNNASYWVRTRILEQGEARDREKCAMKFIKTLKHLRNVSNFNSYLAILSALVSAPIRRLDLGKSVSNGVKEYGELIDPTGSFRAYRQALSETSPPCIPYIGQILQDLTFVNQGNRKFMPDGNINFSKCWLQYNMLEEMKRFMKPQYTFEKNEKIIAYFNNFDNYRSEEELWVISESIKPRGGRGR